MKRFIALLLTLTALFMLCACSTSVGEGAVSTPIPFLNPFKKAKVGDYVSFGHYEQDNDTANGAEEIEWLVLDEKNDKLFVISRYILDVKAYSLPKDINNDSTTWETCTVRAWLNDTFLNSAFNTDEQDIILTETVVNENYWNGTTPGGNDTRDKLFLLSYSELGKYLGGSVSHEANMCKGSAYAKAQGLAVNESGYSFWWLRSPGDAGYKVETIWGDGTLNSSGSRAYDSRTGIRPVMWVTAQ